ncbi:glycerophosphocholine cholinephosphodiesterase ENPP6-like [Centruroides vittatus]|uniref:glycerophosphocholine cholinephosphodiesterase ENPP6-like n=1 Tax=Centruroides vittatus TaxID=120091 RepID=UPI00350F9871
MWMCRFAVLFYALLTVSSRFTDGKEKSCLIIILVDGVRWNYLDENITYTGFRQIADNGVKAEYVTPIFPSNSYPNWYTIVTGRYAENHGFVQNYMYDEKSNEYFLMAPNKNASHPHWWNYTEPLWITAEKNGIRVGSYWWDGCQVEIDGIKASFCKPYIPYSDWINMKDNEKEIFNDILDKCKNNEQQLSLIYYEAVDATGHKYGPDTKERRQALQSIDSDINRLQEEIVKKDLLTKVNLVIVSDHGMSDTNPTKVTYINIDRVIKLDDIEMMLDKGSLSMIKPRENKLDEIINDFKKANIPGLHVFKKEDIPNHYHFKKHNLVLPILLMADEGYYINPINDTLKMIPSSLKEYLGFHGYDPYRKDKTDMRGIFYARGPNFKSKFVNPPVQMTDHYNIFCHILGIKPVPNNGSWDRVKDMIYNNGYSASNNLY